MLRCAALCRACRKQAAGAGCVGRLNAPVVGRSITLWNVKTSEIERINITSTAGSEMASAKRAKVSGEGGQAGEASSFPALAQVRTGAMT